MTRRSASQKDEDREHRRPVGRVLVSHEAVGKTPGEPAGSLLRVGSENGHLVRRKWVVRREVVAHGGPDAHVRKRAGVVSRTAFPDSHPCKQHSCPSHLGANTARRQTGNRRCGTTNRSCAVAETVGPQS